MEKSNDLKYYTYLSRSKVDMLYKQLSFKGKIRYFFEVKLNLGVFSIANQSNIDIEEEYNSVAECCAVGVLDKNDTQGKLPIVFAVLNSDTNEQQAKKDLFELCEAELPEYAQPIDFIFIDKLPLTPIGKVDYRKLEEMATEK